MKKVKWFFIKIRLKILFTIVFTSVTLLIGILLGLFLVGFFGTLSNPSPRAISILHFMGMMDLKTLQNNLEAIKNENIKIPVNYVKGQFSNPDKLYINVKFKDLQQIEYKRNQALDIGLLFASKDDYVPIEIKMNDKEVDAKFRLAGDATGHLKGEKWSFRIKVKDDKTILGMRVFTIRDPYERGYLNEFIFQEAIKREGIVSLRYYFVEVIINGESKGIFALEEHFDKQLIENNKRREGIILKFDESLWWDYRRVVNDWFSNSTDWYDYVSNDNIWFYSANIKTFNDEKILADSDLSKQFEDARDLLESFRQGSLSVEETFDTDLLARFFAINTVFGTLHSSFWHNIRFYYNPITSKLEPIGYDANHYNFYFDSNVLDTYYLPDCIENENNCSEEIGWWWDLFFRDKYFFERYMQELERISEESYIDSFFEDLDKKINKQVNIIHKDTPTYHFSREDYYRNQIGVKNRLNPRSSIRVYLEDNSIEVGNLGAFPIEIVGWNYNNSNFELEDILIQPRIDSEGTIKYNTIKLDSEVNLQPSLLIINYKILGIDKLLNESVILWGKPRVNISRTTNKNQTTHIKEGTIIDLTNGSSLTYYSDIQFLGTKEYPIRVISSDNTGKGISVIDAAEVSNLRYVIFDGLANPIVFYNSEVNIDNTEFSNMKSEDSLNLINSNFKISNSQFNNCYSDCFDNDFSNGIMDSITFNNCGNDCIDFSNAMVNVSNLNIDTFGDKGISCGERSFVNLDNIKIINGYIGLASKDDSKVYSKDLTISYVKYSLAVYQKKPEFGPAFINIEGFNNLNDYIIEVGSNLNLNGVNIAGDKQEVYNKLLEEYETR